ncbi:ANR family transcriptional regulator [Budviciaceae bacterium BWR-B9]|uniref:ANR family transcriptional regulator n=1 Tax=Limnobaculum allomyrinae TaxID=2791986 RepID=A0ABS1ITL5_9GAMM|nr:MULTISPECIES: ANR family transcriptional regulator [Limnobaculum]MBK5145102.1 ANR family transcriptional regulator [Limnobaculum allomyrinae]MBV7692933.1 ANR family transcriptional regulator [Limnobaculum sp. M2-1]
MEIISKVETLRQALQVYGELTAHELYQRTGIPVSRVGMLLNYDIENGISVERSWKGKNRSYRLLPEGQRKLKKSRQTKDYQNAAPVLFEAVERLFPDIAAQAAEREKAADYDNAVPLWLQAKGLAALEINTEYCHHRAQFCMAALDRGWSRQEGGV